MSLKVNIEELKMMRCCSKDRLSCTAPAAEKALCHICPSKLSKRELQDLYFKLIRNNVELKQTVNELSDKIRCQTTRLQRMLETQKTCMNSEPRECCFASKAMLLDQKNVIEDLKNENENLKAQLNTLNMKLCSTKQFAKRTPRDNSTKWHPSGRIKNMNTLHTTPAHTKKEAEPDSAKNSSYSAKSSGEPKSGTKSISNQQTPDRIPATKSDGQSKIDPKTETTPNKNTIVPTSPKSDRKSRTDPKTETTLKNNTDNSNKVCDQNKCRTQMEELQQEILHLQEELSKTHDEYSSRIARLENEVVELHSKNMRVRSEKALWEHTNAALENEASEIRKKLQETEAHTQQLSSKLNVEKSKVAELQTQVKAANLTNGVVKAIEERLFNDINKNDVKMVPNDVSCLSQKKTDRKSIIDGSFVVNDHHDSAPKEKREYFKKEVDFNANLKLGEFTNEQNFGLNTENKLPKGVNCCKNEGCPEMLFHTLQNEIANLLIPCTPNMSPRLSNAQRFKNQQNGEGSNEIGSNNIQNHPNSYQNTTSNAIKKSEGESDSDEPDVNKHNCQNTCKRVEESNLINRDIASISQDNANLNEQKSKSKNLLDEHNDKSCGKADDDPVTINRENLNTLTSYKMQRNDVNVIPLGASTDSLLLTRQSFHKKLLNSVVRENENKPQAQAAVEYTTDHSALPLSSSPYESRKLSLGFTTSLDTPPKDEEAMSQLVNNSNESSCFCSGPCQCVNSTKVRSNEDSTPEFASNITDGKESPLSEDQTLLQKFMALFHASDKQEKPDSQIKMETSDQPLTDSLEPKSAADVSASRAADNSAAKTDEGSMNKTENFRCSTNTADTSSPKSTDSTKTRDVSTLKTTDDSGFEEVNKNTGTDAEKGLARVNQELMKKVAELQTQLDQLRIHVLSRKDTYTIIKDDGTQSNEEVTSEAETAFPLGGFSNKKQKYQSLGKSNTNCELTCGKEGLTCTNECKSRKTIEDANHDTNRNNHRKDNDNRYQIPGPIPLAASNRIIQPIKKQIESTRKSRSNIPNSQSGGNNHHLHPTRQNTNFLERCSAQQENTQFAKEESPPKNTISTVQDTSMKSNVHYDKETREILVDPNIMETAKSITEQCSETEMITSKMVTPILEKSAEPKHLNNMQKEMTKTAKCTATHCPCSLAIESPLNPINNQQGGESSKPGHYSAVANVKSSTDVLHFLKDQLEVRESEKEQERLKSLKKVQGPVISCTCPIAIKSPVKCMCKRPKYTTNLIHSCAYPQITQYSKESYVQDLNVPKELNMKDVPTLDISCCNFQNKSGETDNNLENVLFEKTTEQRLTTETLDGKNMSGGFTVKISENKISEDYRQKNALHNMKGYLNGLDDKIRQSLSLKINTANQNNKKFQNDFKLMEQDKLPAKSLLHDKNKSLNEINFEKQMRSDDGKHTKCFQENLAPSSKSTPLATSTPDQLRDGLKVEMATDNQLEKSGSQLSDGDGDKGTKPKTYTIQPAADVSKEISGKRAVTPENTDEEISSMTDLPSEKETMISPRQDILSRKRELSLGEDKTTTTTSMSTTATSKFTSFSLSEGEMPHKSSPQRNNNINKVPSEEKQVRDKSEILEKALQTISQELARCRQLLSRQRETSSSRSNVTQFGEKREASDMTTMKYRLKDLNEEEDHVASGTTWSKLRSKDLKEDENHKISFDMSVIKTLKDWKEDGMNKEKKMQSGAEISSKDKSDTAIKLHRTEAKPHISNGPNTPHVIFTLHIGTVVLSDEAVINSRNMSLVLTWKFFDQNVTMSHMKPGRVIHFDFSTEYDLKLTNQFLHYLKNEELVIKLCEWDKLDDPIASCSLPLREPLLHTNIRTDMSLALVAGPNMQKRIGETDPLDTRDEMGVLDLWCMLRAEPRIIPQIKKAISKSRPSRLMPMNVAQSNMPSSNLSPLIMELDDENDDVRMSTEADPTYYLKSNDQSVYRRVGTPTTSRPADRHPSSDNYGYVNSDNQKRNTESVSYPSPRRSVSIAPGTLASNAPQHEMIIPSLRKSDEKGSQTRILRKESSKKSTSGFIIDEVPTYIKSGEEMLQVVTERSKGMKEPSSLAQTLQEKYEQAKCYTKPDLIDKQDSYGQLSLPSIRSPDNESRRIASTAKLDLTLEQFDNSASSLSRYWTRPVEKDTRKLRDSETKDNRSSCEIQEDSGLELFGRRKTAESLKSVSIKNQPKAAERFSSISENKENASDENKARTVDITILWLALTEECSAMSDPNIQKLYIAYNFLGHSGAELETPMALPKPKQYQDKCYFNFKKSFRIHDEDKPILRRMARYRSPRQGFPNPNDCIVFTVVSEPVEDPLGLNNCEDIGIAHLFFGDLLVFSVGSDSYTDVIPIHDSTVTEDSICGVLSIRVDGLDVVRKCLLPPPAAPSNSSSAPTDMPTYDI